MAYFRSFQVRMLNNKYELSRGGGGLGGIFKIIPSKHGV